MTDNAALIAATRRLRDQLHQPRPGHETPDDDPLSLRQAVVASVDTTTGTVGLYLGGDTSTTATGMAVLDGLLPLVGDSVMALQHGPDWLVLGRTADADPRVQYARQAADQVRANTAVVANSDLSFNARAGRRYAVTGWLAYSTGSTEDFRVDLVASTGTPTFPHSAIGPAVGMASAVGDVDMGVSSYGVQHVRGGTGGAASAPYELGRLALLLHGEWHSTVDCVATVRVAQGTAGAGTPAVLKAGSWLRAERIA